MPYIWTFQRHEQHTHVHQYASIEITFHPIQRSQLQYWSRRVQRVWCALPARFTSHLLLECRASCVQHLRGMCVGCCSGSMWHAWDAHFWRVCRPFMYCRCRALLARMKCAGPWVTFSQYCMNILLNLSKSPHHVVLHKYLYQPRQNDRLL
jgi:hypothetical protein